jgi:hypothetical protein
VRAFLIGIALLIGLAAPIGGANSVRPGSAGDPAGLVQALERDTDPEPLPAYHLRIRPKPLRRLLAYRERIRDQAALSPDDRLWVPATLIHRGELHPAKLRIRGDLPMHWRGDRQSLRLKFKDRLLEGKKEINLILPWDKHYGVEVLQTRVSADLGLPYFPGRFVHLHINGSDAGFYLENEHPTREYLERTGRPASSIFTFAFYWSLYFSKPYHAVFILPGSRDLLPLKGIGQIKQRMTYEAGQPLLAKKQLAYAIEFYRLMSEGDAEEIGARAGHYLDLDNFASYVALQDFFGSRHAMELNDNIRLYLDPTSGKFQLMPWDTSLRPLDRRLEEPGVTLETLLTPQDEAFRALLRQVPGLRSHKDRILRRLVERGETYRAELNRIHAQLIGLYPEDGRLRGMATTLDRQLARNVEILRRYLSGRAVDAEGGES